jgi:hypothetical protein
MPIGVAMSVAADDHDAAGDGSGDRRSRAAIVPGKQRRRHRADALAEEHDEDPDQNTMPNTIVASDITRLNRFTISRRR